MGSNMYDLEVAKLQILHLEPLLAEFAQELSTACQSLFLLGLRFGCTIDR